MTSISIGTIAVNSNGHIFAGSSSYSGYGVFRSTDNGDSWAQINTGLTNTYVSSLAFNLDGYVFAGTDAGVFRSVRSTTSVKRFSGKAPKMLSLEQNYPNPFNPSTTIRFSVSSPGFVTLKVFNTLGEEIATLVSDRLDAGTYSTRWNATHYASGVYFLRLRTGGFCETQKLVLLK